MTFQQFISLHIGTIDRLASMLKVHRHTAAKYIDNPYSMPYGHLRKIERYTGRKITIDRGRVTETDCG
jgi:hypothetical protein